MIVHESNQSTDKIVILSAITEIVNSVEKTINCRGRLLDLTKPRVMGIINVTPDSFFAGSRSDTTQHAMDVAEKMIIEGVDIIDIGGISTRPGAKLISATEESDRILPVLELIVKSYPEVIISIDTFRSAVVREVVAGGAHIINDISAGLFDEALLSTISELKIPYILMHMQGTPASMQMNPHYDNVMFEILEFFVKRIRILRSKGVKDIIIDPGFGFGKNLKHNYEILKDLNTLDILDCPVLAGISRKSMIYKPLGIDPEEALNGTSALNMVALLKGANILRVHDVKEAGEVIDLYTILSETAIQ